LIFCSLTILSKAGQQVSLILEAEYEDALELAGDCVDFRHSGAVCLRVGRRRLGDLAASLLGLSTACN